MLRLVALQRIIITMSSSIILATLLVLTSSASPEPGWNVGWGFEAHGGFPALPRSWQSEAKPLLAGYFLGNASGLDSNHELGAENRFSVVGLGWQLDNIPSHFSHLEQFEIAEARALKNLRPNARVTILRNTEVGTVFWDSIKAKMYNASTQDWWTQCGGKPCKGSWGSPAGNTDKYWFNFSNPDLASWWVDEFVMGQWYALIVCYAPPHRPVARSNRLLWPPPQASGTI